MPFVAANARTIEQPGTKLGTETVGCTRLAPENLGLLYLDNLVIAPRGYAVVEALWNPDCRGDQLTNAVRIARVESRKSDELVAQSCAFEAEFRSDSGLPMLTEVTLVNTTDTAKALYFLDTLDGHRRLMDPVLAAGESRVMNTMATYVGYSFLVTDTITQPDGQIVPGACMAIFQLPDAGPNKAVLR